MRDFRKETIRGRLSFGTYWLAPPKSKPRINPSVRISCSGCDQWKLCRKFDTTYLCDDCSPAWSR